VFNTDTFILDNVDNYLLKQTFENFTGNTDLQTVTEVGATTDVESTFSGGLITNRIKPTGDTTTALQITKSDNTPIINIDTVSGLTGINELNPQQQIHLFGEDTLDDEDLGSQTNGIFLDGVQGADKSVIWGDNGVPSWYAETYRDENSKFWYLYNDSAENDIFVLSEGGRVGVNPQSNIMNRHAIFGSTGSTSGINDLKVSGLYDKTFVSVFYVQIADTSGVVDTFNWFVSYNDDQSFTLGGFGVECSTDPIELESGVFITFDNLTGHIVGDYWGFAGFPQLPRGTFEVLPHQIDEVLTTLDYTGTVTYNELTANANTIQRDSYFSVFNTGNTLGALYVGALTRLNGLFFNFSEVGSDITLVVEYWNGSSWIDISIGNTNYVDTTEHFTKTGEIIWSVDDMTGWVKSNIDDLPGDEFEQFWLRFRSVSNPTTIPTIISIARGSGRRIGVYTSPKDFNPSFYVDTLGRTNIGGGRIVGTNVLQVNTEPNLFQSPTPINSLVEFNSNDSNVIDLKIKLGSDDDVGPGIVFVKHRNNLASPSGLETDDELGSVKFRGFVNTNGRTLSKISSNYVGDGNSRNSDIRFSTANGSDPEERIRINTSGYLGLNITNPNARLHIAEGTTEIPPLKLTSGVLLTTPQTGAIEFNGIQYFGTTGSTRNTFAFLESPVFTGNPSLPIGTTLNNLNLDDYILNSGGTNNPLLTQKSDFDAFTGSTVPWDNVDKTGSDLADLEIRNASAVTTNNLVWDSTNIEDITNKIGEYVNNTSGSGRLEPEIVLSGILTNTLTVSGGTGYINYSGFHKKITWSTQQFDTSTGYTEGTYWVYVDTNGDVQISETDPGSLFNIRLGLFYWTENIALIQQCGCIIENSTSRFIDFVLRQGIYIYDGGGLVNVSQTDNLKFVSSPCKVQYGMLDTQLGEISSNDAAAFKVFSYHKSADFEWLLNYDYNRTSGVTPTDRWNDVTKDSYVLYSAFTTTFTFGSAIVTANADLTSFDLENAFIYDNGDGIEFMTPVSGVTWDGSETTIILERPYLGSGSSSILIADYTLPKLPENKFVRHLILRDTTDRMYLILAQSFYDDENSALTAPLPSIPEELIVVTLKMAAIVHQSYDTDLTGKLYDIRPLPYQFREGGQTGGGTTITNHGDLSGLANDDHLQYLRVDGARAVINVLSYQSHPTFTLDTHIVDKKYVDDGLNLKLNTTDFNTFTGTTLPANYYNKTEINSYTGATATAINNRLLISDFNTYSATTQGQLDQVVGKNPLYAFAKTQANGTIDSGVGLSVSKTGTGVYDYSFIVPVANTNYGVFGQPYGTVTDTNSQVSNISINGFTLSFGVGDNGGTPDVLTDTEHAVSVYGIPVSGDTEIPVVPASTFITYTANTQTALDLKANLISPNFTGVPTAPTAAINTNTTQIATTAYVVGQASTVNPLMNGITAIGTSLRYSREDHIHPSDTTKLNIAGGTITGSLTVNTNLNVLGTSDLNTVLIDSGLAKYKADYSATYDNRTLVDKEYVDTLALTVLSTTSAGLTTTTSTAYVLQTGMQITNVLAGSYLLSTGSWFSHGSNNGTIYISIYVGGTQITNSEMQWNRPNQSISATHVLANFPITLATTATVEIRWRTTTGTASSTNRYLSLLKI
jgi:hypothetical protein